MLLSLRNGLIIVIRAALFFLHDAARLTTHQTCVTGAPFRALDHVELLRVHVMGLLLRNALHPSI